MSQSQKVRVRLEALDQRLARLRSERDRTVLFLVTVFWRQALRARAAGVGSASDVGGLTPCMCVVIPTLAA